jgi:hypothetical protein
VTRRRARYRALAVVICSAVGPWAACQAGAMRFCDQPAAMSAAQKDQLFRFGAIIKTELDASGQSVALIARSGLDLGRFRVRYSHAGLSLKSSLNTPWTVRQLFYACNERKPRVFDQGMAGFLLGLNDPAIGYVSIVLLPAVEATALEGVALDDRQAVRALGPAYSANAYPFSARYQNCNQWVAEMLAAAWAPAQRAGDADSGGSTEALRSQAQHWLLEQGYQPTLFDVSAPLMWLAALIPWLHDDDHPSEDLEQGTYRVSMPASIEAFVQATVPGASRIEFCHAGSRVVIHRGWDAIAEGCQPGAGDGVITLQ